MFKPDSQLQGKKPPAHSPKIPKPELPLIADARTTSVAHAQSVANRAADNQLGTNLDAAIWNMDSASLAEKVEIVALADELEGLYQREVRFFSTVICSGVHMAVEEFNVQNRLPFSKYLSQGYFLLNRLFALVFNQPMLGYAIDITVNLAVLLLAIHFLSVALYWSMRRGDRLNLLYTQAEVLLPNAGLNQAEIMRHKKKVMAEITRKHIRWNMMTLFLGVLFIVMFFVPMRIKNMNSFSSILMIWLRFGLPVHIYGILQTVNHKSELRKIQAQNNAQLDYLTQLLKPLRIAVKLCTPAGPNLAFFELQLSNFSLSSRDSNDLMRFSIPDIHGFVTYLLTQDAKMILLKEDDNCFIVKRMPLSHQKVAIEAVQAHINNWLSTFHQQQKDLPQLFKTLSLITSGVTLRPWRVLQHMNYATKPTLEFRLDIDLYEEKARIEISKILKHGLLPAVVSLENNNLKINGFNVQAPNYYIGLKNKLSELMLQLQRAKQVVAAQEVTLVPKSAPTEVPQKAKEPKRRQFFSLLRGLLVANESPEKPYESRPAMVSFRVGQRYFIYHRDDENKKTNPGPVVPISRSFVSDTAPVTAFYATDPGLRGKFPTEVEFRSFWNIGLRAQCVGDTDQQGLTSRETEYESWEGVKYYSHFFLKNLGTEARVGVRLAASTIVDDVERNLYLGDGVLRNTH
jgi:hypothetical protein